MFEDLAKSVTKTINRTVDTIDVKNKKMNMLYSNFLDKHARIVEMIVKPQLKILFQIAKSNEDKFLYEIQIRVSPGETKNDDRFKQRQVTWFHLRKSEIVDKGLEEKNIYGLYAAHEFCKDEILGLYMGGMVEKNEKAKEELNIWFNEQIKKYK